MPYITPETVPTETACVTLAIPNDSRMIAAVFGALFDLTYEYNWEQVTGVTAEAAAAAASTMYWRAVEENCPVAGQTNTITLLHRFAAVVVGNALTWVSNAMPYGGFLRQNPPALNDRLRFYFDLAPGDYRLQILHSKSQNSAKFEIRMNNSMPGGSNVTIATNVDFYNASEIYNQMYEVDFTVPEGYGWQLDYLVTGKNPSSGNYFLQITASMIFPI